VPALDGLRGVAILLVFAIHLTVMKPRTGLDLVVFAAARTGWIGVDLFFVLSGFLITGILHDSRGRGQPLRTFYARRFLRIFPLYYGFLFAIFVLGPRLAPGSEWLAAVGDGQVWHWTYLSNAYVARQGWGPVPRLGHLWSLAIEEQFYLLWPLVVLTLSRRAALRVSLGLLAVSLVARVALLAAGASPIAIYALTFTRWDGLAVGAVIALAARGPDGGRILRRWSGPVIGLALLALAPMVWSEPYRSHYGAAMQAVGYPIVALLFGALLVRALAAGEGSRLRRVLSGRGLRFFGRYSYGAYLIHGPLLGLMLERGIAPELLPPLGGSALPGQVVFWVVAVGVTMAAAVAVFHLWERPFLSLKRHFRYGAHPAAQPVGAAPAGLADAAPL
jgi:peptidoglycan/LPS O-acetylase OafA/YrhL